MSKKNNGLSKIEKFSLYLYFKKEIKSIAKIQKILFLLRIYEIQTKINDSLIFDCNNNFQVSFSSLSNEQSCKCLSSFKKNVLSENEMNEYEKKYGCCVDFFNFFSIESINLFFFENEAWLSLKDKNDSKEKYFLQEQEKSFITFKQKNLKQIAKKINDYHPQIGKFINEIGPKNTTKNDCLLFTFEGKLQTDLKLMNDFNDYVKNFECVDHRKLGQQLELFTFNNLAGQGLPIWLPNGVVIKSQIENYVHSVLESQNYNFVQTPVLGSVDLYKISGHWSHYKENMFSPIKVDEEEFVLRPMTCPHHMLIYLAKPHSYKELPFRLAEHAILHRYEASGALIGLERVRAMQLVDTHVVIRPDQIVSEVSHCYETIKKCTIGLGIKFCSIDLSLHDPKNKTKFFNNDKMWIKAEKELEVCCQKLGLKYQKKVGEAAFYGPKIDFQFKTSLNHIITISTIQLDFLLPNQFKLTYKDKDQKLVQPILIHGGIIGTFERFLAILLEQTKGILPLWLAPKQVVIIPIANCHMDFCQNLSNKLKQNNIRVFVDDSDQHLTKKIRNAQMMKIPFQIVIGNNELNSSIISYRQYGKNEIIKCDFSDFVANLQKQIIAKK